MLTAAILASACAGGTAGRPVVLADGGDDRSQARRIAAAAGPAEVIYLGEQHDNPAHHARQRLVLEARAESGWPGAVGFEMLPETRQPAADAALRSKPDRDGLERALAWRESGWPDFAMYWPLFEAAMAAGWPVLALDLDPALTRRIAREGAAGAGPDAARVASLLPPDTAREAALARTMVEAHCGRLPADRAGRLVDAWHARNVTMARRIAAALGEGRRVAVIVGRGHQSPGGLPDQLAALRPGTRQFVVDLVETGPTAGGDAERATADVVWLGPAVTRPDPCAAPAGSRGT